MGDGSDVVMEIVVCVQTQRLNLKLERLHFKLEQLNLKPIDPARIVLAV